MCGVVGFAYRDMLCGIEHSLYSAPASVAFLYAVPYFVSKILIRKKTAFHMEGGLLCHWAMMSG